MASQIETMFTSIRSKIDEEYSRILNTFHQDISINLSPDDFTEDYGKVDLIQHFESHPEGGWFIKIIEYNDLYNSAIKRAIAIDNYGKSYSSENYNGEWITEYNGNRYKNNNKKIDKTLYRLPNFMIDIIQNSLNEKLLNVQYTYITYDRGDRRQNNGSTFNYETIPKILSIFQNLAKEFHNRFVTYKDLFNGNKLKEYTKLNEEKGELITKNTELSHIITDKNNEINISNIYIDELKDNINTLKSQLELKDKQIEEIGKEHNMLKSDYSELDNKLQKVITNNSHNIIKLTSEVNHLQCKNTKYIETISVLNEKIFQLKKHIADLSLAQNINPFN